MIASHMGSTEQTSSAARKRTEWISRKVTDQVSQKWLDLGVFSAFNQVLSERTKNSLSLRMFEVFVESCLYVRFIGPN